MVYASIYKKLGKASAIAHTHIPYKLGIAISVQDKIQHIIKAHIEVGNPD